MVNDLSCCSCRNGILRIDRALKTVWSLADLFMGLMVFTNLIAISFLSKFACISRLFEAKKQGKDPVFVANSIPGLKNTECWDGQDVEEKQKAV